MSKRTGRWYSGLEWGWGGVGGGNRASSGMLYQRMVAPLYIRLEGWRGRRGSSPTQNTVRPQSLLSTPFPMKKSKKGGSLWQDTHREQQRVCFFYLFLSLKEVKRRPGVNSSIPGWWCPPLHEAAGAPELSGGVLCHSQNNPKKKSILGGVESFYMDVLCMLCRGEHTFSACSFYFSGPGDPLSPQLLHRPLPLPHLCFQL